MAKKKAAAKKRNPQDATLRNVRATRTAIMTLTSAHNTTALQVLEQGRILKRLQGLTDDLLKRVTELEERAGVLVVDDEGPDTDVDDDPANTGGTD